MNESDALRLFEDDGVIMRGHFMLTSGRHSPTFLQCSMIMQYPDHLGAVCRQLSSNLGGLSIECVAGPAMGGVILAYEMARAVGARAIYAEKSESGLELRRGFSVRRGERCLVVEDAVTTGGSAKRVMELLASRGAEVVAVAALVDRSGGNADFGVPFVPMVRLDIPSYRADECPLCKSGAPLTYPKSGPATT